MLRSYIILAAGLAGMLAPAVAGAESDDVARIDSMAFVCRVNGNKASASEYVRTTILSPAGEAYSDLRAYESKFVKLKSVEIRLLNASGKVLLKKSKSDMTKVCGFGDGGALYDDNCRYVIELTSPTYPYTIEISREKEYQSLFFIHGYGLQNAIPIRIATVELAYPDDRPVAWKLYGLDTAPSETNGNNTHHLKWVFADIPAQTEYAYSSPGDDQGIKLTLAAEKFDLDGHPFNGRTWKNVGLWQKELNATRYAEFKGPDQLSDSAARQTAFQIYNELIASIRYVFVSIGISGWQPNPAELIAQRRYGDCKDMSTLLVSRLREVGIEAYPCLILTNDYGRTDTSFVGFEFNHVITMALVGRDTLWLDPTCDVCPPGDLPVGDEGNTLVVVTDTGGVLVTTPRSRPEDNVLVQVCEATIDSTGHAALTTRATITGNHAQYLRSSLAHVGADETRQFVGSWFMGNDKKYVLENFGTTNLQDLNEPVRLEASFRAVGAIDRIKTTGYFRPLLLASRELFDNAELKEREIPLNLGYARTTIDSVFVHGPILGACDSVKLPDSVNLSFDGGDAVVTYVRDSSGIRAHLVQTRTRSEVPVAEFDGFAQSLAARKQLLDKAIKFYLKGK